MEKNRLFDHYYFGLCVQYFIDATTEYKIHGSDGEIGDVSWNLRIFFEYLDKYNLQVTKRASEWLYALYQELEKADFDAHLSVEQASSLSYWMTRIQDTLVAELKGFEIYLVAPKRIDVNKLLSDVPNLLAPGIFVKLPDIAQYDLKEAGMCIAFGRSTAAAFHLMRATEAVLRLFYRNLTGDEPLNKSWGQIIQSLRGKTYHSRENEVAILLNNLDNIRFSFRNPTQHPEKVFDIQEVQDLWGLCVDVINRMVKIDEI